MHFLSYLVHTMCIYSCITSNGEHILVLVITVQHDFKILNSCQLCLRFITFTLQLHQQIEEQNSALLFQRKTYFPESGDNGVQTETK